MLLDVALRLSIEVLLFVYIFGLFGAYIDTSVSFSSSALHYEAGYFVTHLEINIYIFWQTF